MLMIVTRKLSRPSSTRGQDTAGRHPEVDGVLRENWIEVMLAYPNQPPVRVGEPMSLSSHTNSAPGGKIQYDSAFSRGKATSRAPIMRGSLSFLKKA